MIRTQAVSLILAVALAAVLLMGPAPTRTAGRPAAHDGVRSGLVLEIASNPAGGGNTGG